MTLAEYDSFAADRHRMMREAARAFAEREIRPIAAELDESERFPAELYDSLPSSACSASRSPRRWAEPAPMSAPMRASWRSCRAAMPRSPTNAASSSSSRRCSPSMARRRSASAISAAPQGRAPLRLCDHRSAGGFGCLHDQDTAVETRDGWRLNGGKLWIHNAPVADFAVVLARTAPELGKRGFSIFLVERDPTGYRIGRKEHKMGQRASPVGALHFDDMSAREAGAARPAQSRLPPDDERARQGPRRHRGARRRHLAGGARCLGRLRQGARASSARRSPNSRRCNGCSPTWRRTRMRRG